jgi:SAM-dependent methyltransferase
MFRCKDCGTEYAEPRRSAPAGWYGDVGEYYGWRWEFDRAIEDVRSRPKVQRVLEIGCGAGAVLAKIADLETLGIDENEDAVDEAVGVGVRAVHCSFRDFAFNHPNARFDAILFFHVLEHVEDPRSFLRTARELLDAGGFIGFSVPNERRLSRFVAREVWDYPPHHLSRFSRVGLARLFEHAGLRLVSLEDQPLGVSRFRANATYANEILRRAGVGEPMKWPPAFRWLAKLPVLLALYTLSRIGRGPEQRCTGTALYGTARACS